MARQTFGELITTTYDYISQPSGSVASSTIANFVKRHLNNRYHFIQRNLDDYIVQDLPQTASTVASQQRYHYPPNMYPPINSATLTVGSVKYPLDVVHSQREWDALNQIDFSGTTIPQYIFPMRDYFEIYPIPQASGNTITLVASLLDRDMTADDYTTGTVTVTNNDETVTGAGTTFTAAMVGRWFKTTNDPTFYRIASFTDASNIELETTWEGSSAAGAAYTIGESPEIPPELHELLPHGAAADYYAGPKKDFVAAQAHNNYFFTGDFSNTARTQDRANGGLIDANRRYSRRGGDSKIINRGRATQSRFDERWTATLS